MELKGLNLTMSDSQVKTITINENSDHITICKARRHLRSVTHD